ncbi:16S rRNA (cytosine(1402)-N(4))-methyltransferase RsmH [Canibacter zhoujuaniae]|uniref:16S rRNA (cytosine(1402)-N(4))-methyltransferase RsmH n=1 Tax=Canibacter zhoujuaniae TaxID=2708343 RepID=UPI001423CCF9|nr:16S rRNA (cytosine(1402)-N(4))-methyltransferase RsmH [Canibacter zhoujuaniae]
MTSSLAAQKHTPVMLDRCVKLLAPALENGGIIVDATLGLGGHSEALLERFQNVTLIGLDRDTNALSLASERLAKYEERFVSVHAVYNELPAALQKVREELGLTGADAELCGVLFDLGVSSMQLDEAERGFAYAQDAPLDMRMDQSQGETAAELLARLDAAALRSLFKRYGDEPLAARYADAIVRARQAEPISRSGALVEILQEATPAKLKNQRHPAKRVFQALRVAVNNELEVLADALPKAMHELAVGGRLVAMAYQSHEDKIVKTEFARATRDTTPAGLPQQLPQFAPEFELLTRGAETASEAEQEINPRSIPVRLRAVTRVRIK